MLLRVIQIKGHEIHPFAELVGSLAGRCQGPSDELAQRFKVLAFPAVGFDFDPLQFRTVCIDLQDRPIGHLVGYRDWGRASGEDLVFGPDLVPLQQVGDEDIIAEAAVPDVAQTQIQPRLGGDRGPEALQEGDASRTEHIGRPATVDDPTQQQAFFLGFAEQPLAELFPGGWGATRPQQPGNLVAVSTPI